MKQKLVFRDTPMLKTRGWGQCKICKRGHRKTLGRAGKIGIILLVFGVQLFAGSPVSAQGSYKALKIGDQVPDVTIANRINYSAKTAKISEFKGKLLILDFWATWCSPCVVIIPRMDSLQKQFEGKVQFLPITYQKGEEVLAFRKKLQDRFPSIKLKFPESVQNRQFDQLFPHSALPHYVWIGGDGNVKDITSFQEITAQRIDLAFKG